MTTTLIRGWWALALRGLAPLLVAVFLLARNTAAAPQAVIFGSYLLADGLLAITGALCAGTRPRESRLACHALFVGGMAGVVVGASSLLVVRGIYSLPLVASWALVEGICALALAYDLAGPRPRSLPRHAPRRMPQRDPGSPDSPDGHQASRFLLAGCLSISLCFLTGVRAFAPTAPLAQSAPPITAYIPILALYLAAWGYLHLCAGLSLGLVRLASPASATAHPAQMATPQRSSSAPNAPIIS